VSGTFERAPIVEGEHVVVPATVKAACQVGGRTHLYVECRDGTHLLVRETAAERAEALRLSAGTEPYRAAADELERLRREACRCYVRPFTRPCAACRGAQVVKDGLEAGTALVGELLNRLPDADSRCETGDREHCWNELCDGCQEDVATYRRLAANYLAGNAAGLFVLDAKWLWKSQRRCWLRGVLAAHVLLAKRLARGEALSAAYLEQELSAPYREELKEQKP